MEPLNSLGDLALELALISALHDEAERLLARNDDDARPSPVKRKSGRHMSQP